MSFSPETPHNSRTLPFEAKKGEIAHFQPEMDMSARREPSPDQTKRATIHQIEYPHPRKGTRVKCFHIVE